MQTDSGFWDEEKRVAFTNVVESANEILIDYEQSKDGSKNTEKCAQTTESGNLEKLKPVTSSSDLDFLASSDDNSKSELPDE